MIRELNMEYISQKYNEFIIERLRSSTSESEIMLPDFKFDKNVPPFKNYDNLITNKGSCLDLVILTKLLYEDKLEILNVLHLVNIHKFNYKLLQNFKILGEYDFSKDFYDILFGSKEEIDRSLFANILNIQHTPFNLLNKKTNSNLEFKQLINRHFTLKLGSEKKEENELLRLLTVLGLIPSFEIQRLFKWSKILNSIQILKNNTFAIDKNKLPEFFDLRHRTSCNRPLEYFKEYISDLIREGIVPILFLDLNSKFSIYSGHAILVYGIRDFGDDAFELRIYDPNITFLNSNKSINNEIEKNVVVVFDKDSDHWRIKYNPYINGKYIYRGEYTSYNPNFSLSMIGKILSKEERNKNKEFYDFLFT